jgi:hypothetical protein
MRFVVVLRDPLDRAVRHWRALQTAHHRSVSFPALPDPRRLRHSSLGAGISPHDEAQLGAGRVRQREHARAQGAP